MAEQFGQIKSSLAEQFSITKCSLTENCHKIKRSLAEPFFVLIFYTEVTLAFELGRGRGRKLNVNWCFIKELDWSTQGSEDWIIETVTTMFCEGTTFPTATNRLPFPLTYCLCGNSNNSMWCLPPLVLNTFLIGRLCG